MYENPCLTADPYCSLHEYKLHKSQTWLFSLFTRDFFLYLWYPLLWSICPNVERNTGPGEKGRGEKGGRETGAQELTEEGSQEAD